MSDLGGEQRELGDDVRGVDMLRFISLSHVSIFISTQPRLITHTHTHTHTYAVRSVRPFDNHVFFV